MLVFSVPRFFFTTWVIVVSLQMHGYRSCIEKERKGLLELNAYVNSEFPYDWPNDTDSDCCQWDRVRCNFTTGSVVGLFLNSTYTVQLKTLNLDYFNSTGWFDNIHGYKSLGKLKKLEILDLSHNFVNNSVFLNAASPLKTLILHGNNNMKELKDLRNLKLLDLSGNMLSGPLPDREDGHDRAVEPTPQHSSLPEDPEEQERVQQRDREQQERVMEREMYGRSCGAKRNPEYGWTNPETGSPYHPGYDAGGFAGNRREKREETTEIAREKRDLGGEEERNGEEDLVRPNKMRRPTENLKNLRELDLSRNEVIGRLPQCFSSLTKLEVLDISSNKFSGTSPSLISNLSSLQYLSLSDNEFEGVFSVELIANLSKLKVFKLSSRTSFLQIENKISLQPRFQLSVIELQYCNLETVPRFLQLQKDLRLINLSNNKLTRISPSWFLENYPRLQVLLLQNNSFTMLQFPRLLLNQSMQILDVSSNKFYQGLPESRASLQGGTSGATAPGPSPCPPCNNK
ncbi:hypothetical protein IGI04_002286 [Brassica rapa subsp. trilocularis]|uniref:Leucine-rich repeat-containing N-terminal plant-type domain-containing protein n=1 Tax=Brassica rapa subsp. trilocularis TaxID=1813537 RepID=A0ABQ7NYF4_BRACM|nr:hypothetical protein IGI04_002286 [Brassica rapa subsp. trilocularis]